MLCYEYAAVRALQSEEPTKDSFTVVQSFCTKEELDTVVRETKDGARFCAWDHKRWRKADEADKSTATFLGTREKNYKFTFVPCVNRDHATRMLLSGKKNKRSTQSTVIYVYFAKTRSEPEIENSDQCVWRLCPLEPVLEE